MKAYTAPHIILALTLLLIIGGCTSAIDESAESAAPETVAVSLAVECGNAETRAGDATPAHIDRIVCAVYDISGNLLPELGGENGQTVFEVTSPVTDIPLVLVKGQQYKIVLWAQSSSCEAFDTSDLSRVTVDYSKIATVGIEAEAFSKAEVFTAVTDCSRAITLRRVFARVCILADEADFASVGSSLSRQLTQAQLQVDALPSAFNAVDDTPIEQSEATDVHFSPAEITSTEGTVTLASAFMLAPWLSTTLPPLHLQLSDVEGNNPTPVQLNGIVAQRNWSTNITLSAQTLLDALTYKPF